MKTKIFFTICLLFGLFSCNTEEMPSFENFSLRDGEYSDNNLAVFVNDKQTDITAVVFTAKEDEEKTTNDNDGTSIIVNAVYNITATMYDFPGKGQTTVLTATMSDYRTFEGETELNGKSYTYAGEFTDSPFISPKQQQLIIRFTEKSKSN